MRNTQAIGGAADAARMQRVVSFYEKLPRGSAPEPRSRGFLGWYANKYMGKKPSPMRECPLATIFIGRDQARVSKVRC